MDALLAAMGLALIATLVFLISRKASGGDDSPTDGDLSGGPYIDPL